MFLDFFLFELKLRLKSISTYVYFMLWFLIAFFSVAAEDFGPSRRWQSSPERPLRHAAVSTAALGSSA